jgi:hypothetical protein
MFFGHKELIMSPTLKQEELLCKRDVIFLNVQFWHSHLIAHSTNGPNKSNGL